MQVFVQALDGMPANAHFHAAWEGFGELGWDRALFDTLDDVDLDPDAPVVGYVGTVHAALAALGLPAPAPLTLPPSLARHWGRRIERTTLGALRATRPWPVFVKPAAREKVFDGHVVRVDRDLARIAALADDTPVLASEVVDFAGEHRVFVVRGRAVGCGHYRGDFRARPDFAVADDVIAAWPDAPRGYAVDLGVTCDGRTLIVEPTDGYSLAAYGLRPALYARLLEARWWELTQPAR